MNKKSDFSVFAFVVCLGVLLLCAAACSRASSVEFKAESPPSEQPLQRLPLVRVTKAKVQKLAAIREFIGRLQEKKKVTISPEVSGLLVNLPVEEGDKVTAHETVIAEIDQTWTKLALEQAKTQIELADVQIAYQTAELNRMEKLLRSRSISDSEVELQRAAVAELGLQLEAAKLSKQEAEEKLKRSTLVAPFDGFIVQKTAEVGQLVATGTNIVDIISRGNIDAIILVSEAFINRIHIGDKIPIQVETLDEEIQGEVIAIVPYGPSGSRTFPVKIQIDNFEEKLKSGMSLKSFVTISDPSEGIVVPIDAVLEHPEGQTVWVAIPDTAPSTAKAFQVPVKVDIRSTNQCLVSIESDEGKKVLVDGAQVVIEGAERLAQNQLIRIVDINPEVLKGLPLASGHETITPKPRREAE